MTVTDPTLAALHAAILADPADDAPRMMLADLLQERGDPRGEFIAVQLEIARLTAAVERWVATPGDQPGGTGEDGGPAGAALAESQNLEGRERELLEDYGLRWTEADFPGVKCSVLLPGGSTLTMGGPPEAVAAVTFRRGFVEAVTMTAADFMQHAAELFRAAPVTTVVLSDREPADLGYGWAWDNDHPENGPECIPDVLWHEDGGADDDTRWVRANPADCRRALALRCVAWGRNAAGLAPSPPAGRR